MSATHRLRHRHIVSGLVYGLNIRVSYRSNRSAALLKLNKVAKALADADAAIARDPQWDKGFFRKAAALEFTDSSFMAPSSGCNLSSLHTWIETCRHRPQRAGAAVRAHRRGGDIGAAGGAEAGPCGRRHAIRRLCQRPPAAPAAGPASCTTLRQADVFVG